MKVWKLSGVEISPTLVSEITEDLDEEVKAWQTRRLEAIWPIVFMDVEVAAHHFDVRPARCHSQSDLHDEHDRVRK